MKTRPSDDGKFLRLVNPDRVIPFEKRFLAVYFWYNEWIKAKGSIDKRTFMNHLNIGYSMKVGIDAVELPKTESQRIKEENIIATETICKAIFSGQPYPERWSQHYQSLFYWHGKTQAITKNLKTTGYKISIKRGLFNEHTQRIQEYELTYNVSPDDYLKFFVHKDTPPILEEDDLNTVFKTILVLECKYWLD